ncbi:hypothetical protein Tco_0444847 [Tanacetum coccineum]
MRASFFWGGGGDKRKMTWIKWDNILASFDKGSLEIGSLKALNLALLQKWRWRFVHNTDSLWVRVIKAIHGDEAGFNLKGCNSNGIWSSIISSYSKLLTRDIILAYSLCRKVGDGGRNVAALNVMVSEIGHVYFNNHPDAWSWKISDSDSLSVQATRSHIDNCLLSSLSPSSRWSKLIPRKPARRAMLVWNLMTMFSSNVIRLLIFGVLFARGQAQTCPPSPLVPIGYNGSRIGVLQKNLKTVCMSSQRLLCSWKKVMASKDTGGLGVASLFALNRALMFKWVWRFITQKKSLWTRVIKAIYDDDGKIGKKVNPSYPSIWLSIIQEAGVLKSQGIDIISFIKPKCGDGTNTSFWNDAWRGDVAFKDLMPRLYMLENMKDVQVATKLSHEDLEWSFRRKSRSGVEQHQLIMLQEKIEGCILSNTQDRWTWSLEGSGDFSVSSVHSEYIMKHRWKSRYYEDLEETIAREEVNWKYLPPNTELDEAVAKRSLPLFFLSASTLVNWLNIVAMELASDDGVMAMKVAKPHRTGE